MNWKRYGGGGGEIMYYSGICMVELRETAKYSVRMAGNPADSNQSAPRIYINMFCMEIV